MCVGELAHGAGNEDRIKIAKCLVYPAHACGSKCFCRTVEDLCMHTHSDHHANVRLTTASHELRIFSRTFCFDPLTFEEGADALSSSYKEHSDVSQMQKPGLWASQG